MAIVNKVKGYFLVYVKNSGKKVGGKTITEVRSLEIKETKLFLSGDKKTTTLSYQSLLDRLIANNYKYESDDYIIEFVPLIKQ